MSQNTWYLTIQKGPSAGQSYPLRGGSVTLGRHPDNQIVINDSQVSRHHARLTWQGSTYSVEDLGSANGTWVNNRRISQATPLRPGDTLGLSRDIVLSFGGQSQGTAPTYLAPEYAAAASPPARSSRTWLLLGIGGVLVAAVAVVALVLALAGGKDGSKGTEVVQVVTATATQGSVFVTATSQPTAAPPVSPPTEAPSATPQPTYTPYPTYTPFPTATPTDTPTPTPQPTYTAYPTYTPYPTQKPPKPTSKPPQPTNTPKPTANSQPPYTLSINKIEPEPWGRPSSGDGCSPPYNDRDPVKRFTIELVITNQSNRIIPDGWHPVFYTAQGQTPITCVWYYDNTAIQPGETAYVTFVTHTELNDYVQYMLVNELGYDVVVCFNAAGQVVACP